MKLKLAQLRMLHAVDAYGDPFRHGGDRATLQSLVKLGMITQWDQGRAQSWYTISHPRGTRALEEWDEDRLG